MIIDIENLIEILGVHILLRTNLRSGESLHRHAGNEFHFLGFIVKTAYLDRYWSKSVDGIRGRKFFLLTWLTLQIYFLRKLLTPTHYVHVHLLIFAHKVGIMNPVKYYMHMLQAMWKLRQFAN